MRRRREGPSYNLSQIMVQRLMSDNGDVKSGRQCVNPMRITGNREKMGSKKWGQSKIFQSPLSKLGYQPLPDQPNRVSRIIVHPEAQLSDTGGLVFFKLGNFRLEVVEIAGDRQTFDQCLEN